MLKFFAVIGVSAFLVLFPIISFVYFQMNSKTVCEDNPTPDSKWRCETTFQVPEWMRD